MEYKAQRNDVSNGRANPSLGKTIAKVAFGLLFIVTGFTNISKGIGYLLTALIVGGALVAWGVIPLLRARQFPDSDERPTTLPAEESHLQAVREPIPQLEVVESQMRQVVFEEVPALSPAEEAALVEIDNPQVIAQIDAAIPLAAQLAADAMASKAFDAAASAFNRSVNSSGKVYQAIIPAGAELANSRAMEGAKRGIFHGPNGIQGHANWVEQPLKTVDAHMADSLKVANAVNAAMNIASMVVGQYYMAQINNKMAAIHDGIDKISEFQDMEYRSRVMALVAAVQQSATFKYEIMASDELRTRELSSLKNLEIECAQLLGQANLMIQERTKDRSIDYAAYERLVNEIGSWFDYQQILMREMDELAELTYTLSLGAMSRENSYALCDPYTQQCAQVGKQLAEWHGEVVSNLEIDLVKSRRRKQRLEAAAWTVPGLFNDDLNYTEIPSLTKARIDRQSSGAIIAKPRESSDFYGQNVHIVKRGGKTYYLPTAP